MFSNYFLVLALAHLTGDYYLQNEKMADFKSRSWGWLLVHGMLYALPYWMILIFFQYTGPLFCSIIAATGAHLFIDAIKKGLHNGRSRTKRRRGKNDDVEGQGWSDWLNSYRDLLDKKFVLMLFDQMLHFLVLLILAYCLAQGGRLNSRGYITLALENIGIQPGALLHWAVALAAVWKPANLLISLILQDYEPVNRQIYFLERRDDLKAGRMIGLLERVIILLLVALGQPAGISLVLAAKTLARFNRIKEDEAFAERYLIGTLLSTFFAIGLTLLLN